MTFYPEMPEKKKKQKNALKWHHFWQKGYFLSNVTKGSIQLIDADFFRIIPRPLRKTLQRIELIKTEIAKSK